jgi:uncharacterized protein (TIGR03790 family)
MPESDSGYAQKMRRIVLLLLAVSASLAQGPENVLIVVNRASPVSRRIGDYYRERRGIPETNVCAINAPVDETVPRRIYDAAVAGPIAACLKSRRLEEKILYIATTLGVPLRIDGAGGRDGDQAAVDSELALLYQDMRGARHEIRGAIANPFFGQRNVPFTHPRFPIYLVCRLAAYDFNEVAGMIDRALVARNRGRVVIDMKSPDDGPGNEWLRNAAILLPKERVVFDQTTDVLYGERSVIGYASWGSNDPHRKRRFVGFEWLPGAIATEFVSSDGRTFVKPPDDWNITSWRDKQHWFADSPQSLSADYIHEGATGVSGHVAEPYLGFTPRPDFLLPAYLSGRTLAESYYLAIPALSWQNIVIGDPLCRLK